ncbi:MAG: hypothetical protein K2O49_07500, partial [Muribaculaceae bacterium]|nr:hypothetical protein [Muribaculaceae bacterium]
MTDNKDLFQFDDFSGVNRSDSIPDTPDASSDSEMTEVEAERIVPESISPGSYDDNAIQHLDWNEHIRRRPGMYIGKLGDGSHAEDGIYVLIK